MERTSRAKGLRGCNIAGLATWGKLGYTADVRAKKIVAVVVATGYFFALNCRFVCAMEMPNYSPVAVEQHEKSDEGACHHQDESKDESDGQKSHSAPCCMTHLDDASALLPTVVVLHDAASLIAVLPIAVSGIVLPMPRLPSFWADRGPPLIVFQVLASSSRGPRAPPSPTVVL
jgi:hypothetical protein